MLSASWRAAGNRLAILFGYWIVLLFVRASLFCVVLVSFLFSSTFFSRGG